MSTITVKKLFEGISEILQDTADDQAEREWPDTYLVDCYNLETRDITSKFPDACTITEAVKLPAGPRHNVPAAGIALISVLMNMGTDGETYGSTINQSNIGEIACYDPDWASATEDDVIINFMPDPADPRAFYVNPPADGTSYVLMEYSVVPDQIVYDEAGDWESELVAINEKYLAQLEKRIIARCYKKDTDIPGNQARENDTQNEVAQES